MALETLEVADWKFPDLRLGGSVRESLKRFPSTLLDQSSLNTFGSSPHRDAANANISRFAT